MMNTITPDNTIAAFTPEEARAAFLKYNDIRVITLKLLYSIPGYQNASTATKNSLYDLLSGRIKAITPGS